MTERPRPRLETGITRELRKHLPQVAQVTVESVIAEVPSYKTALTGSMRDNIERAVEIALGTFLRLVESPHSGRTASVDGTADQAVGGVMEAALSGAYALGRGEERSGR